MASTVQATKPSKKKKIPQELIYEEMDGQPIYYAGYREVLNNNKTLDDIMGSSHLQVVIINLVLKYLYKHVDESDYEFYTNEAGLHLSKSNNLAADIAIYRSDQIKEVTPTNKYLNISPEVVIEVDTKADLTDLKSEEYLRKKTQKLLDFGVKKVIWILSASQLVILAENDKDWLMRDWHKPFDILPDHFVNLGEMLKKKGVK
ncbi:MAG: Uma2 family endonuclease [Bacteroidota bacterium]